MNCKPGDLAVIKTDQPQPYGGRLVDVVRGVGTIGHALTCDPGYFWEVKPVGWHPGGDLGETFWFPDHRLRPIRDQPGEDEILRIAGKPCDIKTPEVA